MLLMPRNGANKNVGSTHQLHDGTVRKTVTTELRALLMRTRKRKHRQ